MSENKYVSLNADEINRIDSELPPEEELLALGDFFKVFGDATRLKILSTLKLQPLCVQDLADVIEMSQSAVSHQLRVLKQNDLVKTKREGKTIIYSLADDHIITILQTGFEHIEE